jgi:hypothetical protein
MLDYFYNGNIDNSFFEYIYTTTLKSSFNIINRYRIKFLNMIIKNLKKYCLTQEIFEILFNSDSEVNISTFLENKFLPTDNLILKCNSLYLEQKICYCIKYGYYCSPKLIDHLTTMFFTSDLHNYKSRRSKSKCYYSKKGFNKDFCDRIKQVTTLVNDDKEFEEYKKIIINKIELYKKIDSFNTEEMIDYIKSNDITEDIIIIMSESNNKTLYLCMKEYFNKINKKNIKIDLVDTNNISANVSANVSANKKIVKKVVKKIVKVVKKNDS